MKNKSVVTIVSVAFNLALFAALAYTNKYNNMVEGAPAPFYRVQSLSGIGLIQPDVHATEVASNVK